MAPNLTGQCESTYIIHLCHSGLTTLPVKEVILKMTADIGSMDQAAVAQVELKNLMVQRLIGDRWEDWCGPISKTTADYYISNNRSPKYELRVVPYIKGDQ